MNLRIFAVRPDNENRGAICQRAVEFMRELYAARQDFEIVFREPKRSLDSNAAMWATLADIAKQVPWPHVADGGEWVVAPMSPEDWKSVLTSAFERETRMAQGVGGGMVMIGASTSRFSKRRMGEFLEFVHAFGAERGVEFSQRARDDLAQYAERRAAA